MEAPNFDSICEQQKLLLQQAALSADVTHPGQVSEAVKTINNCRDSSLGCLAKLVVGRGIICLRATCPDDPAKLAALQAIPSSPLARQTFRTQPCD